MKTKICSKCNIERDVCEFGKSNKTKNGLRSECKSCRKNFALLNKEKISEYQKKYYNINRDKKITYQKKYYKDNDANLLTYQKNYYNDNLEKKLLYSIKYRTENNDKIKTYRQYYQKEKYQTNPLFKLKQNIRHRVYLFLKSKNIVKSNKTFDIVGCSPKLLKEHLEKQFTKGMTWDNHGQYGWHIDHIIPLSSANTEEEIYKLCHYTNLQPLWAEDNLKKGIKII